MDQWLLEENIKVKLHDLGFGNEFSDMTPKAQAKEKEINYISSEFQTSVYLLRYKEFDWPLSLAPGRDSLNLRNFSSNLLLMSPWDNIWFILMK